MTPQASPPPNVRTNDGRIGRTQAMPDDRVLITLDDGRTFVVEADRLQPQDDGTYLVALNSTDRISVIVR
jgi:hypothetical protein